MIPFKKTCFLIDDDVDDQEIFKLALSQVSEQFVCITANNGYEALQTLKSAQILPDFIFLDLNMPRMNGKECLKEMKKIDRLKNIPVIIYTTSSLTIDITDTRSLGASDFITKPISVKVLTDTLRNFFYKQKESSPASIHK